ncbi:MAG: MFS transporter [Betaproteobacteria bacterium]
MNARGWRTPAVILVCASVILMISVGTRQAFGLFLRPMSLDLGLGREQFGLAIALQNLIWGAVQPLTGVVADKFGAGRVLVIGGLTYALGLACMAYSSTAVELYLSAGVLIGLGLSASAFGVVMGVVARAFEPRRRSWALGIVGAGGSFGQFAMLPYGQALITGAGWRGALLLFAASAALIVFLAVSLAGRPASPPSVNPQSARSAVVEAMRDKGFWLLTFSFAVCGFQTVFMMVHLPAYLLDRGLSATVGVTALAIVGLCNTVGSFGCGMLGARYRKKYVLTVIFALRAVALVLYLTLPLTAWSTYVFAAVFGLTWLGTVPLTNALVADIFGVRYVSTLFGIAFFGHQVGSFFGAWYGGYAFDADGSYAVVWLSCIVLSVIAAAACWPIDDRSRAGPGFERAAIPA